MANLETAQGKSEPSRSWESMVAGLSTPHAFPSPVSTVDVRQTHISVVFIGGDVVYKLKKPISLPFLDFSTIEQRQFFCHEEVWINQRWAPGVYQGVVPITRSHAGFQFEGDGPVVDWAVKMRRLPEFATLRSRLQRDQLTAEDVRAAARRISGIHAQARRCVGDEAVEAVASFRHRMAENWDFARRLPHEVIQLSVLKRIEQLVEAQLEKLTELLLRRARTGCIRDVHGDLRLEHIYLFEDLSVPEDIVILDGIEFDRSLREIDVLADMAFVSMELAFAGRSDLADEFTRTYIAQGNDFEGAKLLPLFIAYRSAVRAKVASIVANQTEIAPTARQAGLARSRAHWLFCLSTLEVPERRPMLVLMSGLPGTGKSVLSRQLAEKAQFNDIIRSDVIRKELAVASPGLFAADPDLYSQAWSDRTYDECWLRARRVLELGHRVIVDATFHRDALRQRFIQLAIDSGTQPVWLECRANSEITIERLRTRRNDASDADWSVHRLMSTRWEPASVLTARFHRIIDTSGTLDASLAAALSSLSIMSRT